MPTVTIPIGPEGLVVALLIRPAPSQIAALQAEGLEVPAENEIRGFIDTGASHTFVHPAALEQKGMKVAPGSYNVGLAQGSSITAPCFDVEVAIVQSGQQTDWISVRVGSVQISHGQCFAAIGLDILAHLQLGYDGPNSRGSLSW
jgi:hypothetical protein